MRSRACRGSSAGARRSSGPSGSRQRHSTMSRPREGGAERRRSSAASSSGTLGWSSSSGRYERRTVPKSDCSSRMTAGAGVVQLTRCSCSMAVGGHARTVVQMSVCSVSARTVHIRPSSRQGMPERGVAFAVALEPRGSACTAASLRRKERTSRNTTQNSARRKQGRGARGSVQSKVDATYTSDYSSTCDPGAPRIHDHFHALTAASTRANAPRSLSASSGALKSSLPNCPTVVLAASSLALTSSRPAARESPNG